MESAVVSVFCFGFFCFGFVMGYMFGGYEL